MSFWLGGVATSSTTTNTCALCKKTRKHLKVVCKRCVSSSKQQIVCNVMVKVSVISFYACMVRMSAASLEA